MIFVNYLCFLYFTVPSHKWRFDEARGSSNSAKRVWRHRASKGHDWRVKTKPTEAKRRTFGVRRNVCWFTRLGEKWSDSGYTFDCRIVQKIRAWLVVLLNIERSWCLDYRNLVCYFFVLINLNANVNWICTALEIHLPQINIFGSWFLVFVLSLRIKRNHL